jgi:hypothetical protein
LKEIKEKNKDNTIKIPPLNTKNDPPLKILNQNQGKMVNNNSCINFNKMNEEKSKSKNDISNKKIDKLTIDVKEKSESLNNNLNNNDIDKNNYNKNNDINSISLENLFSNIKIKFDSLDEMTDGDEEMKESIIFSFIEEFPKLILELKNSFDKKNTGDIFKYCHKIKTPISIFGMSELLEDINFIEKYAKDVNMNIDKISLNFKHFEEKMEEIYIELKKK